MKELKFRGIVKGSKATDPHHHRFIYGNLVEELSTGRKFILDVAKVDKDTKFFDLAVEIERESGEQYTGLKDKNGREIYEGDVVCDTKSDGVFADVYEIAFDDFRLRLRNEEQDCYWELDDIITSGNVAGNYKIIGNIHENKELIE